MSLGGFLVGMVIMAVGFFLIYRTDWMLRNFGDIGIVVGLYNSGYASWKFVGFGLIILGFLIAFGLIGLFFEVLFSRIFSFGGL